MLVTCSDYGWTWPDIVTSCAREPFALTDIHVNCQHVYRHVYFYRATQSARYLL